MQIDPQRLNALHNELKALAGDNGAFVLLLMNDEGESDRNVQVRFVGTDTRIAGLLKLGSAFVDEHLYKKFKSHMKALPTEPD